MQWDHPGWLTQADRVVRLSVQNTYPAFPGRQHCALKVQTACTNLLYCNRSQCWLSEGKPHIYCVSLILWLLSVANYLYPDCRNGNHMAAQNAWALMYVFSHIGFPRQTPCLNMTCEPRVYFLLWLCVCVCVCLCRVMLSSTNVNCRFHCMTDLLRCWLIFPVGDEIWDDNLSIMSTRQPASLRSQRPN